MTRQPLPPEVEAAIQEKVEYLFTNGCGERAGRLVLMGDHSLSCYLGGWGRPAIADKLREAYALGLAAGAQGEREALIDTIEALRIGPCWCDTGDGNPHSAACLRVQSLLVAVPSDAPAGRET